MARSSHASPSSSPPHHNQPHNGALKACLVILWYTMIERLAIYGLLTNLITYLTTELCEGTAEAAKNVNNWFGVSNVISIISAFVADAYLGQFRVILIMSIVYTLGLTSLTLLSVLKTFKQVECDRKNSIPTIQATCIYISLYFISIGSGAVRPCIGAFGADQFNDTDPVEKQRKSSFFNWWYFMTSVGCLLSLIIITYIQDNVSWGISFGVLAGAMLVSFTIFLAASPFYRSKPPNGSPFISIVQVLVASILKWNIKVPDNSLLLYENNDESLQGGRRKILHTEKLRFLDKAATSVHQPILEEGLHASSFSSSIDFSDQKEGANLSPWKLCSVTQVEEVKLIARVIPFWITEIVMTISMVQVFTLFTKQGTSMDRRITSNFTIPSASLLTINTIFSIIILPIYDSLFVPIARRLTGKERGITMLQRLGVGIFFSIITMVAAAFTERKRLYVAKQSGLIDKPKETIPMTIFWLFPQYFTYGFVYSFGIVGLQEFFYSEMPDNMKNMGVALVVCAYGIGNFLCSILITVVDSATGKYGGQSWFVSNLNRCHLDYFYWLIAALCTINFFVYLWVAHYHVYRKV